MPQDQMRLRSVHFTKLKGLNNLLIEFPSNRRLHALMGPNGCGKSTVLHALACVNSPMANTDKDYKFCLFFTPTSNNLWKHSSFEIKQDFYERGVLVLDRPMEFHKGEGRWMPHYDRRTKRYISYIGVNGSVPKIELEKQHSRINFATSILTGDEWDKIKNFAGIVLNRNYEELKQHQASHDRRYLGVKCGGINYSSLSMGAGEQRVFTIAEELVKAKKGGMILIEEIELLLHQDALLRLLDQIKRIADNKNLQIIFTSHSPCITQLNYISLHYLYQTPTGTLCFDHLTDEGMRLLTGVQERPIRVFVEDELAKALVGKVASDNGMRKQVDIKCFGACSNLFTLDCGLLLQGTDITDCLFVLDGDVARTEQEKKDIINRLITGTSHDAILLRQTALEHIKQFVLPDGVKPEPYYNKLICNMDDGYLTEEELEIKECCQRIVHPAESHKYLDDVISDLGVSEVVGLSTISTMLSHNAAWNGITQDIKDWLISHRR